MRKKLNIKLIIILAIIISLLIVGGVLFFTTDFFRTKRSAFFRYFNNTTDVLNLLSTDEFKDYNEKKYNFPYIRKGEMRIQNSSNIADSGILDKIKFEINERTDNKNQKSNIDVIINRSNTQIAKIQAIREQDRYGMYCEDVSNTYIGVKNDDLKRIADDCGINNMFIPEQLNILKIKKIVEISKNERKHLLECANVLKNNVPTTAYSKAGRTRIKINNKSYTTTAYSLSLDSTDNAKIQADLLEKISTDSILMDFFASKFKLIGMSDEYTKINSLNDIMKKKAESLKKNPSEAGKLTITVFEYKQKNVRTEIKDDQNTIVIDHIIDENIETASIKINNKLYAIQYNENNYSLIYQDDSDNEKKIKVDFNQDGKVENNDIKNNITITMTQGIKSITYSYNDSISFTSDIGNISGFNDKGIALLNDYNDEEIKTFIENLKQKINSVYVSKGASIGINLDPLFNT